MASLYSNSSNSNSSNNSSSSSSSRRNSNKNIHNFGNNDIGLFVKVLGPFRV